uniref:MULE transposase domain-containing protein n=1 Tax=Plectus sambesii TaxID=2011161 RepID=A0A914X0Z6_9BILA
MDPYVDELSGKYVCRICGAVRRNKKSYNSHRQQKHGTIRNTLVCPVSGSCEKLASPEALRKHLKESHGAKAAKVPQTFASSGEFLQWKDKLQKETNSLFVQWTGVKEEGRVVYHCCRAGEKRSHRKALGGVAVENSETRKTNRRPRAKGTMKMNAYCPAVIHAKFSPQGVVEVSAYLEHYGHEEDIYFISLSTTTRDKVKQKLKEGFAPDRIADFIRKDKDSSVRDRQLKTKDVLYILRQDLPELIGLYNENDHVSVDMAVTKFFELGENNPVFFYRPRTAENDNFAIGIQTPTQRMLLDEYGGNVVCLDTTHKACHYDGYLLGTVLVLDSTGAGQPVAWFLVKGESEAEMSPVFAALKERHPNLRPKFYMSDCADAFWNSWRAVFDIEGVTPLYCIWHVWRAWNAHIMKVVDDARRRQLREMLLKLTQASTPHAYYSL